MLLHLLIEPTGVFVDNNLYYVLFPFIAVIIVNWVMVEILYPSLLSEKNDGNLVEILKTKTGEIFVLSWDPIPYIGDIYTIKPPVYKTSIFGPVFKDEIFVLYKNTTLTIPVSISFKLREVFDVVQVFSVLSKAQAPRLNLDLTKYVLSLFKESNKGVMLQINTFAQSYIDSKISEPHFLNNVANLLSFPEKIFASVNSVTITLDKPEVSVCKEN